jgi:hypothetical protein
MVIFWRATFLTFFVQPGRQYMMPKHNKPPRERSATGAVEGDGSKKKAAKATPGKNLASKKSNEKTKFPPGYKLQVCALLAFCCRRRN